MPLESAPLCTLHAAMTLAVFTGVSDTAAKEEVSAHLVSHAHVLFICLSLLSLPQGL